MHEHSHEANRRHLAIAIGGSIARPVRKRDDLTRAQALREAVRRYVSQTSDRQIPFEDALPDEIDAIEEGQAQIARGEYVLLDDLKHEMARPPKQ